MNLLNSKPFQSMAIGKFSSVCLQPFSHTGDDSVRFSYALVIPAYNEAATIRSVAQAALQHLSQVIVVDDGSTDSTSLSLEGLPLTVLRHPANMGKAASLWLGFQYALAQGATAVATMDGDGQHSPEDLPRLLHQAEKNPDCIIIGARKRPWTIQTWHRIAANRIADFWISWAAGYFITDSQSGFRVYPTKLLHRLDLQTGRERSFVLESEILIEGANLGFPSVPVFIESEARQPPRPSYFHPIVDIARITIMVGKRLLSQGLAPKKLFSILFRNIAKKSVAVYK